MKSVLVTGGTGYIGSYIIPKLIESKYKIYLLDLNEPKELLIKYPEIQFIKHNLLSDTDLLSKISSFDISHLLHLAWYTEHGKFWNAEVNKDWLTASLTLFKIFSENGGKHIVAAGTCAEYEWGNINELTEESPTIPDTLYGQCKKELYEQTCKLNLPLSFAWGRVFFLYGPGENHNRLIPHIINQLSQGRELSLKSPTLFRDFIYVDDVAESFYQLVNNTCSGPFNIASGNRVRICDIANKAQQLIQNTKHDFCITSDISPDEPKAIIANVDRLNKFFTPKVKLEDGLKMTINSFLKK